ncbi:MAG: Hpt domain-containing protein [Sulfuritalea sp.]|nr:Hpt domain-containing protein [Sulfuritalea sp.]
MADLATLLQPRIADREGLREFAEALEDQAPGIERDIAALRKSPADRALIARLFRALHTIKGDAGLCKVDIGVALAHPLESLLARCRAGEMPFSDLLAELMLLTLDRLEMVIEAMDGALDVTPLKLPQLVGGLESLAGAPAGDIAHRAAAVIEAVTGFRPRQPDIEVPPVMDFAPLQTDRAADLWFFSTLALQLENRAPAFAGRTDRLLRLALDTNAAAGDPVDAAQLAAAVYTHDIGMMFLPESVWLKSEKLSDADRERLRDHPQQAAGLLQRMPGWTAAAEMVRQHHEKPCGRGYPEGLAGDAICPGAKILAIVDAFEAVTLKHSNRGQNRSLIRAIAEVNACDDQFAAEWIEPFNRVIRKMVES